MPLFAPDLLEGIAVALSAADAAELEDALSRLGASVQRLPEDLDELAAEVRAGELAPNALVRDARADFVRDGLDVALQRTWEAVRAVAVGSLIARGEGGKVILIAPAPDAGSHAEPARAALENLARTLSVEWARYGITVSALAPGPETSEGQIAELVCFLISPAGDYYSGARFDLGLIRGS
jgi:NAD(P)-dependent dehydrogenase (short-subunit alcohol dehydrogenase family)